MSEQTTAKQQFPDQLSDILLVLDKDKMKIQAVKSIDENGDLQTVDVKEENQEQFMRVDRHGNIKTFDGRKENQEQFMRVDKHGDIFSNFFSNFLRQLKNPTRFSFFKVPASQAVDAAQELQKQVDTSTKEGAALMSTLEVKDAKEQEHINKHNMETTQTAPETGEYRFKPEQIDWETMSNLGLSREKLEKMNLLDPLLKGYKTNELVPISLNLGTVITRTDARLSLQPGEDGNAVVAIHGIRKEPNLNFPFFGHKFTDEDKENLLKTGNMGRVVDLTNPKTGETIPSIISVDRLTNELIALRADKIKVPDEIKGVKLDEQQKQTLQEGKPLYIEGMISKKGEPFDATLQYNADKRYVEFLFGRNNVLRRTQGNEQSQSQEAPRVFRGKELDDEQYQKFKAGKFVHVSGLVDKKGQQYQGYIKFDAGTGKTSFSFNNPDKLKEKVKPTEAHKTQVAVNSEGKTNEATKNINGPLKSGQKKPDSEKQQREQQEPDAPAKSRGRKM